MRGGCEQITEEVRKWESQASCAESQGLKGLKAELNDKRLHFRQKRSQKSRTDSMSVCHPEAQWRWEQSESSLVCKKQG